ncbi:hypothetical protein IEQ34_021670 [Dendrobium chrysotoxum]|uniref:Uncharacterized protein n=1 Tax=Dendrobium chrysotoxum TaxID=161865 RepID=A0AAV7G6I8_DENCH|nr:hypothetical protein IEQ34_021670 [Dendrobium chrysotoxum]
MVLKNQDWFNGRSYDVNLTGRMAEMIFNRHGVCPHQLNVNAYFFPMELLPLNPTMLSFEPADFTPIIFLFTETFETTDELAGFESEKVFLALMDAGFLSGFDGEANLLTLIDAGLPPDLLAADF